MRTYLEIDPAEGRVVEALNWKRMKRDISYKKLGDMVGITERTMSSYLKKRSHMPLWVLLRVMKALEVSWEDINGNGCFR